MTRRKGDTMIRGRGTRSPYSKRLLTESLISSGFVSRMAQGIAEKVVPKFVTESQKEVHEIAVIIVVRDYEAHKARFYQRYEENPDRSADRYLKRFEAIRNIQGYISNLAHQYDIPLVDNVNLDQTVESTLEEITKKVQKLGIRPTIEHISLLPNA